MSAEAADGPISRTRLSDTLDGPGLDEAAWYFLEYPVDDGESWICREPSAQIRVADGACTVGVDRFELAHAAQPIDNCKFVALSRKAFDVPETGSITVSAELSGAQIGASGDYRDGFAALVVLDLTTGLVFDIAVTGEQVLAIHEKLPIGAGPFTRVVDTPLAGLETAPGVVHRCAITLDRAASAAVWEVDGTEVLDVYQVEIPRRFVVGMGIFTLRPTRGVAGTSIRGQGLHATWADIEVVTTAGGRRRTPQEHGGHNARN